MKVDIIIPVYKPDKSFFQSIEKLEAQTIPVNRIILMNTEEKYFSQLFYGTRLLKKYSNIDVYHLSKKEFNHGKTRRQGVKKSTADIFVMMTQDAMPRDEYLLENLLKVLEGEKVAAAYGRQLPGQDANPIESYLREFNYPEKSEIKSAKDIETKGIKAFFCSDVCCAYKRSIYDELGGFVRHTIFNEDMIYAAGAIKAGYEIAYAAQACVVHSHNYKCMQQLRRNFDLGVSQADHPEIFAQVPSEGEGIKSVKATAAYLKEKGIKTSIATSSPIERTMKYLGRVGLDKSFDEIVSGYMVPHGKPEPDVFLYAAKKLGVKPDECLVLEDSPTGLLAAYRAGCIPVMVPDLDQPDDEVKSRIFAVADDLMSVIRMSKYK